METRAVLGTDLAAATYRTAVERILEMAADLSRSWAVEAANTMVVTLSRHDPEFRKIMERFDFIVPDGMPLVWCLNRQLPADQKLTDRVYGPTLMLRTFEATQKPESPSHFLLGGAPDVLEQLQKNMEDRFPGAVIAGAYSPPFGEWPPEEHERIFQLIRDCGASLIWVGLGCPKQERWIARFKDCLPPGVYFGIGAAFAFHANRVRQAPAFLQKIGMEWAFRMLTEPRRLFRRYLVNNSLFLWYLLTGSPKRRA
ncbi:MAG: glycosyl transferase, WecB/TagA/CpsF family [Verrucomicrobiales bacterium]|nr:glycosyl transferase, WecB/TagA/CpsF family [Verrucomicrobiales bacterium]